MRHGTTLDTGARQDVEYVRFDPFDGDRDVDIRARKVRLVTTRKSHKCYSPNGKMHAFKSGTRARHETAIVDGEWGSYYTCLSCIDKWMDKHCV